MTVSRRAFLQSAVAATVGFGGFRSLVAATTSGGQSPGDLVAQGFGPLITDAGRIIDLPRGFSYSVISRAGDRMDDGLFVPGQPDGMGAFAGPDGRTILIRNHEILASNRKRGAFGEKNELLSKIDAEAVYDFGRGKQPCLGGTTTLLYDTKIGRLEKQYLSLAGTQYNCAGGVTPWGTWITCEEDTQPADDEFERDHGYAFEVPARADGKLIRPVPIKPMGRFRREAVAVDPRTMIVYQSEDREDGVLYRYIPNKPGELLAGGRQQALCVRDRRSLDARNWLAYKDRPASPRIEPGTKLPAAWIDVDDLDSPKDDLRKRAFAAGAACFARMEGMWWGDGCFYFVATTGGRNERGHIWRYTPGPNEGTAAEADSPGVLELFIEPNDKSLLDCGDNVTVSPWGDLIVCEDGEDKQYLVGVTPEGRLYKFARNAADLSEFAGATFSPDGSTMFVNLQGAGMTLAITGPWGDARRA
jgi:secreted PhoX family phosphatase